VLQWKFSFCEEKETVECRVRKGKGERGNDKEKEKDGGISYVRRKGV
jgi:hypothetical protein